MFQSKIQSHHLERKAVIYVRQSSAFQVEHNKESRQRQYNLHQKAVELGFQEIEIIDEDQGISGSGEAKRPGFQRLQKEIQAGMVGAVFGLEVSRFARNGLESHQLMMFCHYTQTLIIDQDGIYDLSNRGDAMILGVKGTLGEMELSTIKSRMVEARWNKAKRGELISGLPVGYVKTRDNRIEKDPNERIQGMIELLMVKFSELNSIRQVFQFFSVNQIAFPVAKPGRFGWEIQWKTPNYSYLRQLLKNPVYAGAYAFGRRHYTKTLEGGEVICREHLRPATESRILIKDHHPAYISWEQFEHHQRKIAGNTSRHGQSAVRKGDALLSKLLICGRCGRKLSTRYTGKDDSYITYYCSGLRNSDEADRCFSVPGAGLDQGVCRQFLQAVGPLGIEAARKARRDFDREVKNQNKHLLLAIEAKEFEVERAYRQYDHVDPENRIVARQLEHKWNQALEELQQLKRRFHESPVLRPLDSWDLAQIERMAKDLPLLWSQPSTTPKMRKRLLRAAIENIVVDRADSGAIKAVIHWKGGIHTPLRIPSRPIPTGCLYTKAETLEQIKQLARQMTDKKITWLLNRIGSRTGSGKAWNQVDVRSFRSYHKIPVYNPKRDGCYLTLEQTTKALGLTARQIRSLLSSGHLQGSQVAPNAPWAIKKDQLDSPCLKKVVNSIKKTVQNAKKIPRTQDQPTLF